MSDPNPDWLDTVAVLCRAGFDPDGDATGGAQVQVFNRSTGERVYRQPIAREVRHDPSGHLLWFRQIIGEGPRFDLEACRRRSLSTADARQVAADRIEFPQTEPDTGQYAVILAADPDQLRAIDAWDTWKLSAISASQEADLDALDRD